MNPNSISVLQRLFSAYPEPIKKSALEDSPTVSKAISRLLLNDPPLIQVTAVNPPKPTKETTLEPAYTLTAYGIETLNQLNQGRVR
jgi:hypothetical protein